MCVWARACVLSRLSRVWLFVTLWTIIHQAPLSMRFSRQEHWSGLPFPSPVDLPNPGIEPASLMSPALAGRFLTTSSNWEVSCVCVCVVVLVAQLCPSPGIRRILYCLSHQESPMCVYVYVNVCVCVCVYLFLLPIQHCIANLGDSKEEDMW